MVRLENTDTDTCKELTYQLSCLSLSKFLSFHVLEALSMLDILKDELLAQMT